MKNITYVGAHVRRTDYIGYINPLNAELIPICHLLTLLGARHILHFRGLRVKRKFNVSPVKADYFLRHMNVFRNKYQRVMFIVVSDDPEWCERELRGDENQLSSTGTCHRVCM
jgi:hypothetical protein